MHLKASDVEPAVANLLRVVRVNGKLIITYRGSSTSEEREDGKLYTPIKSSDLTGFIEKENASLVSYTQSVEEGRGHTWHNFVIRK